LATSEQEAIDVPVIQRNDHDGVRRLSDWTPVSNERLTEVGAINVKVAGTNTKRTVPAPWIDCDDCARRHYPSTLGGRWHIATTCLSCGAALPGRE
jgi:hypothetical protein